MRKRKWVAAAIIFLVIAVFLLPQIAAGTHYILSKTPERLSFHPLDGWRVLVHENKPRQLYLIFAALLALVLLLFVLTGSGIGSRTNMQQITPDIYTPVPDGQGQFGTARWMNRDHIQRHFAVWKRRKKGWFQDLMDAGKNQYKEVREANVKLD